MTELQQLFYFGFSSSIILILYFFYRTYRDVNKTMRDLDESFENSKKMNR